MKLPDLKTIVIAGLVVWMVWMLAQSAKRVQTNSTSWLVCSSNQTAGATSGSGVSTLLSGVSGTCSDFIVDNEGTAPGFVSADYQNGASATWARIPASSALRLTNVSLNNSTIAIQRSGSTDMSNVFVFGVQYSPLH